MLTTDELTYVDGIFAPNRPGSNDHCKKRKGPFGQVLRKSKKHKEKSGEPEIFSDAECLADSCDNFSGSFFRLDASSCVSSSSSTRAWFRGPD